MLVVAEVAFSVALLVGAGLLVKSMFVLLRTDYSFNPDSVLTMELKVSRGRYQTSRANSAVCFTRCSTTCKGSTGCRVGQLEHDAAGSRRLAKRNLGRKVTRVHRES